MVVTFCASLGAYRAKRVFRNFDNDTREVLY